MLAAARLGLSREELALVLEGSCALVEGRLRGLDELSLETWEAHSGVAGVQRTGAAPEGWVRQLRPLLSDPPMAYDLVQRWLLRAQTRRARLLELGGFRA